MRLYQSVLLFVFIILNASCVREDIIPLESGSDRQKLVVFGFLTPGNSVLIRVGKTQPFGSAEYKASDFHVNDAAVSIRNDDGLERQLEPVATQPGLFKLSQTGFPIRPGQTFHLQVRAPSFETVSATTTVPAEKAVWRSVSVNGLFDESYGGLTYELNGSWASVNDSARGVSYGVAFIYSYDEAKILQYENEGIRPTNDGYVVKRDIYFYNNSGTDVALITRDKHYGEFSRVSELTNEVLNYFENAEFADIISGFKGVIPQGSNVQNGLGVFGSYLIESRTFHKDK